MVPEGGTVLVPHVLTLQGCCARGQKTPTRGGPFPKALDKATLSEESCFPQLSAS